MAMGKGSGCGELVTRIFIPKEKGEKLIPGGNDVSLSKLRTDNHVTGI